MKSSEITALVDRAQAGDARALEELLASSTPAMQRLAGRVCPPAEAEDAVQEVLFRVSSQVGALRVSAAFMSWSMKMLVRECLRLKNKAVRWVAFERETSVAPQVSEIDLARAVASLGEKSREILLHREILGRTAPETAELLGISLESAKSRLRRARLELRELYS